MRKSRFSEEQIIHALKEHEAGTKAADICRRLGIADQTFYRWKAKFGGMEVSDARRLKNLEIENAKLLRMLGQRDLDIEALRFLLRKKMVKPADLRKAVGLLRRVFRMSERRARKVVDMPRCSCRYRGRRKEWPGLRKRLLELAAERKRFGSPRLYLLLRREGFMVNHKRVERLYKEEGLWVRKRIRKRLKGSPR